MKRACIKLNANTDEQNASSTCLSTGRIRPIKINFARMKVKSHAPRIIGAMIILIIFSALLSNCDIKESDVSPASSYTKVYESANTQESYYPLDIIQTNDKGFLILSSMIDKDQQAEIFFPRIHLTKVNEVGHFEWQQQIDNNYLSAVSKIMSVNNQIFILCMKNLNSALLQVTPGKDSATINEINTDSDRPYPLAAFIDNQTIITSSYFDQTTHINAYDLNFNRLWSSSEPTGEDIIVDIRQHLTRQGTEYPFFIGKLNDQDTYFANAFRRSTLSLMFIQSGGNLSGYLTSFQDKGVISSCVHLQEDQFAISRYYTGDNFVYPGVSVDINTHTTAKDYNDILLADLKSNARINVMHDEFNSMNLILYASTSKTNQISLYFFDAKDNSLVKTHFLGHTNPVEIASLIRADDGSLIVLGKTWVSGRYQRIILYKISLDELGF